MLNGCQVGRSGWPVHPWDVLLLKEVPGDHGTMWRSVVILEDGASSHGPQSWHDNGPQNVVSVASTGQSALDKVQGGPPIEMDPTPHHYGSASVTVMLPHGTVVEPLALPPPDMDSAIVERQSEAGLISEEHLGPLLSRPPQMTPTPDHSSLTMSWSERDADSSIPGMEACLVKTVANSLVTDVVVGCPQQLSSELICGGRPVA